jgi:long-subunit fatty acid transport protein
MKHVVVAALLGLLLAAPLTAPGQSKTGTTVGQFLLIEPSARTAAMGNAGATASGEILSGYYNPASIGLVKGIGVQFTHSLWLAEIQYNHAAAALSAGAWGNFLFSITSLNSGEIDVTTVALPHGTGERYTVSDLAFSLGYGREVSERFAVGVQVSYLQETIWHTSMNAVSFNVGTIYRLSTDGLRIGASISNFGTRAKFNGRDLRLAYDQNRALYGDNSALPGELFTEDYPLPVLFRVGLGLPIVFSEDHRLTLAADAFHPSDNTESVSVGAEWVFMDILALRGGYQNLFLQDSEVGLTLGAGVQWEADGYTVCFDYAWADQGRLERTQRFTLGVSF